MKYVRTDLTMISISTDTQKLNLGWSPSRKLSSDAEDLFPAILAYLKDIRKEI